MCILYHIPLQRLLDAVKKSGEGTSEGVLVVIWDQPYSTRQFAELGDSEHDWLSPQDLSHYLKLLSSLMELCAYVHIFVPRCDSKPGTSCWLGR